MKLACASASLHREIDGGELTQLEFVDLCARELPCDGVVLDVRHFPRFDDQYLAQIKKMAADCGLTVAALEDDALIARPPEDIRSTLSIAQALGAPLLATQLSLQTQRSWSEELVSLTVAASAAKSTNVTLSVRNVPETFASSVSDVKRALKETDSAWMRLALDGGRFDGVADLGKLHERIVLLWAAPPAPWLAEYAWFRGFAVLDGAHSPAGAAAALRALRGALCDCSS